jgi:3-oxoacyl-[acyl-carrier protein] reductase
VSLLRDPESNLAGSRFAFREDDEMDLGLKDKVALVSGGSAGMGYAIAAEFAAEGAKVMIVARREGPLAEAAAKIRDAGGTVAYVVADMTRREDVSKAVAAAKEAFGMPDIAVANVRPIHRYGLDDASDDDFRTAFDEMVLSQVYLARELIPSMKEKGWGRFLNISTVCAKEPHRWLNIILSSTGRPALLGLNKVLSNEFSGEGITINTILPGLIDTGVAQDVASKAQDRGIPEFVEPMPRIPTGRSGTVEEIAGMSVFLCSERASYITGQAIAVDGGWIRGLY